MGRHGLDALQVLAEGRQRGLPEFGLRRFARDEIAGR
jgi:hypothetical protein